MEAPPKEPHFRYFRDAPSRKHDQNLAIGWDLLDHRGWENNSYGWNVSFAGRINSDTRDSDGHLIGANTPDDTLNSGTTGFGQNDVWHGSGISPADYKDIDTMSLLRPHEATVGTNAGYYEYILHYTGTQTDPNTGITKPDNGETSGGIHSYAIN